MESSFIIIYHQLTILLTLAHSTSLLLLQFYSYNYYCTSLMDKRVWEIKQDAFDPKILAEVRLFRIEDLNDAVLKENWLEVAKRFSKMKLTTDIL